MKLHAERFPIIDWLVALLGLRPSRPAETKPVKPKPRSRHRHAAFLELP